MNKKAKIFISHAVAACMIMPLAAACTPTPTTVDEGYVVTFDYNDGSSRLYSVLVDENNSVSLPSEPFRTGNTFAGWFTDRENGEEVTFSGDKLTVQSNTTLYAHWDVRSYSASFHYNFASYGGSEEDEPQPVVISAGYGSEINAPDEPVRTDGVTEPSVFYRWEATPTPPEDNPDGVPVSFPYEIRNDVDFYARWVKGLVNVTFDMNYKDPQGNPVEDMPASTTVRAIEDEVFNIPSNLVRPVRQYYDFIGWNTDPDATRALRDRDIRDIATDISSDDERNVTLYGIWRRSEYRIAFRVNHYEAPGVMFGDVQTVIGGDPVVMPETEPTREGYTFIGWFSSERGLTPLEENFIPTSSGSIYAHWKKDPVEATTFDAEFVTFDPMESFPGFSGAAQGRGVINPDSDGSRGAHTQPFDGPDSKMDNAYVTYLYKQGATLRFEINSSAAVDNVTLSARLATEINRNLIIGPTGENAWRVVVNGTDINYTPLRFVGLPAVDETAENYSNAFNDYTISTNIHLNAGPNVIELIVANSNAAAMGGTMQAVAPMVDSITLTTSATLTWSPVWDNMYNWQA